MRLLFDEMLKKTAKWLRIFGISAFYEKVKDDEELLSIAKRKRLFLVTKDRKLAARCRKLKLHCLLLEGEKIETQLSQLKRELKLKFPFPEKTRCPSCNCLLKLVSKEKVRELVPDNVLKRHGKFWKCIKCKKAYWEGSHWKNITRIFRSIK